MRIFYCSLDSANNYAMPWSNVWNNNLYNSLVKLGNVILPSFSVSKQYAECFARIISIRNPKEVRRYYSYILFKDIKKEKKKEFVYFITPFQKRL